jgi:hypothetical protein
MRFLRPRITIRSSLFLLAIAAVGMWLSVTAARVARECSFSVLCHVRRNVASGELYEVTHVADGTFWPRYRRALLGQAWPGSYQCPCAANYQQPRFVDLYTCADQHEAFDRWERLTHDQQAKIDRFYEILDDALRPVQIRTNSLVTSGERWADRQ